MKKTIIKVTIDQAAGNVVASGGRLDVLKRTKAVAGGLVRIDNVDYDWVDFCEAYWQATNAAKSAARAGGKTTRTSYSTK